MTEKPKRILTDEQRKHKAQYNRERYLKKRTQILAQQKEYYKDNQSDIRARRKDYWTEYNSSPEKVAKSQRKYKAKRNAKESKS